MKFQAIIFDLDGTIIDTQWIWQKAKNDLLASRNVQLSEQQIAQMQEKMHSVGLKVACDIIRNDLGVTDSTEILVQEMQDRASNLYQTSLTFIPGFETFHKQALSHQLKCSIATSSDSTTLGHAKKKLNLELFFGEHIYDIEKVDYRYKPDPAIYLLAAEKINIAPQHCIAIEDSAVGITAAKRAGMFCIGIDTAKLGKSISHADIVVDSYEQIDLPTILQTSHSSSS